MKNWIIISILLILVICIHAQDPGLYFEHLTNLNGLSNNRVYSILQDKKGFIWIGTLDGLNRYDGYSFKAYKSNPEEISSQYIHNNRIIKLYEDKDGFIWIGTRNNGVEKFDPHNETFIHFPPQPGIPDGVPTEEVKAFFEQDDTLYIQFSTKVCKYDKVKNQLVKTHQNEFSPKDTCLLYYQKKLESQLGNSVQVNAFLPEENGFGWLGTRRKGLFILKDNQLQKYSHPPFNNMFEIRCIYQDFSGMIWIGTRNNGLFKHNPATRQFKHFNYFKNENEVVFDLTVRAITEDVNHTIWIGTYNNGIIRFNREKNTFTHLKNDKNLIGYQSNMIRSLFVDSDSDVWVGSYAGVRIFDWQTQRFTTMDVELEKDRLSKPYVSKKLYSGRVYGFSADFFDHIWIANWDALSCYDKKEKSFQHYPASFFGVDHIRKVFVDKNNTIWIGCEYGGMIEFNATSEKFERYFHEKSPNSLVNNNVFDIHEDRNGQIWMATFNGLDRFNREKGEFNHFFTNQGLSGNMVYGILNDDKGNMWFTTTNGMSKYSISKNEFANYDSKSGLIANEFAEGGFYKSPQTGEFIVGGINGFQIFDPDSITPNTIPPKVVLTNLRIMNKTVQPGRIIHGEVKLKQSITYVPELKIEPQDKIVTIEFAALHYAIPQRNRYRYKLEGFDEDWVTVNHLQRSATYTNLWPGEYVFKVQGANSDHVWSSQESELKITVLPPFWLTWWAILMYVTIIVLLLIIYRYYTLKKAALKNALVLEKIKLEKAEELNVTKMNFFTNISHEFRTPLSLIMAPLEKIMDAPLNTSLKDFYTQFRSIRNNARKLLDLTNQVLDLRKVESGNQALRLSKIDVSKFVRNMVLEFKNEASNKNIKLSYECKDTQIPAHVDVQMLERILFNLLSNAFKFTHTSLGKINVQLGIKAAYPDYIYAFSTEEVIVNDFFELSVEDNGIGINPEHIHKIFNRFYRVDNEKTSGIYGSGVGLSLLKELVLLHKGQILVRSELEKGSLFTIRLPLKRVEDKVNVENELNTHIDLKLKPVFSPKALGIDKHKESGRRKILLVDDNEELLTYLKDLFDVYYDVFTALNGKTAIQMGFSIKPDIIISDIAMPGVSGIEMCKRLKNDLRTCSIPIILLTARASEDYKIKSYQALADEYIEKPFQVKMLVESVKRLIKSRDNIIESFVDGNLINSENPVPSMEPLDHEFITQLNVYLETNVSNVSLSVEELSKALGISRSSLHNRLKGISGLSASAYIRSKRIQKAAELLGEKRYSVLEIAYQCGFNSPSYFIKCFKNKYGITPKEFKEQSFANLPTY